MNTPNRKFVVIAITAFLGLGMSMPSCPGQQEMRDQITALQTTNADLNRKLQAQDAKVKTLTDDMDKVKQLLQPMTSAIQAQKAAMDQLDANLKELQNRMVASKPAAKGKGKAAPAKKRH